MPNAQFRISPSTAGGFSESQSIFSIGSCPAWMSLLSEHIKEKGIGKLHLQIGVAALMIHSGHQGVASHSVIDAGLGQGGAPHVQQEAALLAWVAD